MRRRRRPPMRRGPLRHRPGMRPHPEIRNRAHRELQRAHHLMEIGDYKNAADLFERLARALYDRGILRQAPGLFLQAGKACILAGDLERGRRNLRQGLEILVEARQWQRVHHLGNRVVSELEDWGHKDLSDEFKSWLDEILPDQPDLFSAGASSQKRPQLPLTCPACGGPIRPNDVEWLDANTAECPYCASGLRE